MWPDELLLELELLEEELLPEPPPVTLSDVTVGRPVAPLPQNPNVTVPPFAATDELYDSGVTVTALPLTESTPSQSWVTVEPFVLMTVVHVVTAAELPFVRVTDAQ